jgi:hypothetical protein
MKLTHEALASSVTVRLLETDRGPPVPIHLRCAVSVVDELAVDTDAVRDRVAFDRRK